jgi:hypothetical protein
MSFTRTSAALQQHNNYFQSMSDAQNARLGEVQAPVIYVLDAGELVAFRPSLDFTDLTAADGSTWRRISLNEEDLIAVVADAANIVYSITRFAGDWTPALAFAGGGGEFSYGLRAGRYRVIDGLAYVEVAMDATVVSLGSGNLRLTGLQAGLGPMAGNFRGFLQMPAKGGGFFVPYGAAEVGVSWTPGAEFGVFQYYGSSGQVLQYVTGVTGNPGTGDFQLVTWGSGGSARLEDWRPDPAVANAGRLSLVNVLGGLPTGTITGQGWTATAAGLWQGAPYVETFLNAGNLAVGMNLNFNLEGTWRVA